MGRQSAQEELFYEFRLEDHVPADHLLRRLDAVLNFNRVRSVLAGSYSQTGRPLIDPELMLHTLLIGYAYGIHTERQRVLATRHSPESARPRSATPAKTTVSNTAVGGHERRNFPKTGLPGETRHDETQRMCGSIAPIQGFFNTIRPLLD